jgi:hypothetical protein
MPRLRPLVPLIALLGVLALTPPALGAAPVPTETYASLLHQIDAKKGDPQRVVAATIDKARHHVRVTLADGSRPLIVYPTAQDKFLVDTLLAHHIRPKYTPAKKVHHVLRYIAAGVVAVLLLIGAGVWFYTRGREHDPVPSDPQPAARPPETPPDSSTQ